MDTKKKGNQLQNRIYCFLPRCKCLFFQEN